jgi:integrase/recombinase XerD
MTKKITPTHLKKHGKRAKIPDSLSQSLAELALRMREFLEHLKLKNYSPSTVKLRRLGLNYFLRWCSDRSVASTQELNSELIAGYEKHLLHTPDADHKPFSAKNRHSYLEAVGRFCKWLVQQDILPNNPAQKLNFPKIAKEPPAQILCHQEIEQIVAQADVKTPYGLRNRAIMELLYSTGMRRAEAAALVTEDVDVGNGLVAIRHGKGDKARVVPLGERACQWIGKYLLEARGLLAKGKKTNALWLSQYGRPLSAEVLSLLVHECVLLAGLSGSCHIFRHAMASHMLDNGAGLRHIQEMLGHEQISTTQIYTHPSSDKIRQAYQETHPANAHSNPPDKPLVETIRRRPRHVTCEPGSKIAWPENDLSRWVEAYQASLHLAGYRPATIELSQRYLKSFVLYCQEREISQPQELTMNLLQLYHKHLLGKQPGISLGYISGNMKAVRLFCAFLTEQKLLTTNIADKLPIPKKKKTFPCQVLSSQEVESLLQQPDTTKPLGLRDRAIIEILYATGLTRQELIALRVEDVLFAQASVRITKPKNGEKRIVPVPPSVLAWVEKYLREVRPMICDEQGASALFLGMHGLPLCQVYLNISLQHYARKAGITKHVTCIQLRHAMATAMLDNGADLRHVQEILGHSALHSTQVYTKVAIRKLKEVHTKTHPARSQPSHDAGSGHDATDDHNATDNR